MAFKVYFAFSSGLSKPVEVPKGTMTDTISTIEQTENVLGITREEYNGETRWHIYPVLEKNAANITDEQYCKTVLRHNDHVRRLYETMVNDSWKKWKRETEVITPEDALKFWFGLRILDVPVNRWTDCYYREQMESIYEAMRGREHNGMSFDEKPLTPQQAASVIRLFSQWMDRGDIRLDVPRGYDHLASSCSDEYYWCASCGCAVDPSEWDEEKDKCTKCAKKRKSKRCKN